MTKMAESQFITDSNFTTKGACTLMTVACVKGVKVNDVSDFNVSFPSLIKDVMKRKHLDELQAKVIDLDKKVTVQPEGKYSAFLEGIEKLMFYICHKLKSTGFTIRPKRTGSLYAGIKVGLPLETDYVYIIEDLDDRKLHFSDFIAEINNCIGNIEYIKDSTAQFKIIRKKKTRVAYCLTFECRDDKQEMREGFSVDIVPARWSCVSDKNKIKYRDGAKDFIRNCDIKGEDYPITLLSTRRDSLCDLGLMKHSIFRALHDDIKRELRAAKYLATFALRSLIEPRPFVQGLDGIDSKRLSGSTLRYLSSFYVCGIFLHILIAAHKSNCTESLKNGVLTLCTLELLTKTFQFFAKQKEGHAKKRIYDPLVADLMYENHLYIMSHEFQIPAGQLDDEIGKFLKNKDLDEFNLRVFEKTDTECDRYFHHFSCMISI